MEELGQGSPISDYLRAHLTVNLNRVNLSSLTVLGEDEVSLYTLQDDARELYLAKVLTLQSLPKLERLRNQIIDECRGYHDKVKCLECNSRVEDFNKVIKRWNMESLIVDRILFRKITDSSQEKRYSVFKVRLGSSGIFHAIGTDIKSAPASIDLISYR